MSDKTNSIPWRAILLESGFVVFGLVLALAANSWLEARQDRKRAVAAMRSITEEFRLNQDAVDAAVEYHAEVVTALRRLQIEKGSDPEAEVPWTVFQKGFIYPATTTTHAWSTASVTGATERVPYEQLLLASKLHQEQSQYQSLVEVLSEGLYGFVFSGGTAAVRSNWRNHIDVLSSLVYRECELARAYREVLPQLTFGADTAGADAGEEGPRELPAYCKQLPTR